MIALLAIILAVVLALFLVYALKSEAAISGLRTERDGLRSDLEAAGRSRDHTIRLETVIHDLQKNIEELEAELA